MNKMIKLAAAMCGLWLCACNDAAPKDEPLELGGVPSFAVRLSDYQGSAGIAVLDGDGKVLSKKVLSSGSALPGLSEALPGDIALPTQPCSEGELTVIARTGGNYLLQQDLDSGKVVRQVKTQRKSAGSAYSSNPYDVLCLDDGATALVSRFEPNLADNVNELDRGDDVVAIDLTSGDITRRISLAAFAGEADGFDADGNPTKVDLLARPSQMVRVGNYAVVGLARLTVDFATAGTPKLALIDLADDSVEAIDLPEPFRNCGFLMPVAGRDDAVVVSCSGSPFGNPASAGLLIVSVDEDGASSVEETFRPGRKDTDPAPFGYIASLGGTRVFAVDSGDYVAGTGDRGYVVDLATDKLTKVLESSGPGLLGDAEFREDTGLLLVPDASKGVWLFTATDSDLGKKKLVELPLVLPPRGVRALLRFR